MYSFPFITKRFWFSHENMSIYTPEDSLGLVWINKSGQVLLKPRRGSWRRPLLAASRSSGSLELRWISFNYYPDYL